MRSMMQEAEGRKARRSGPPEGSEKARPETHRRGDMTDHTIVANSTKVFKASTGEEVSRIVVQGWMWMEYNDNGRVMNHEGKGEDEQQGRSQRRRG